MFFVIIYIRFVDSAKCGPHDFDPTAKIVPARLLTIIVNQWVTSAIRWNIWCWSWSWNKVLFTSLVQAHVARKKVSTVTFAQTMPLFFPPYSSHWMQAHFI